MTIAEEIEKITDRSLFEKIAVDILRERRPDFWGIIHGGSNAKGETITSSLDAFQKLPNGDFILIEVTTTDAKNLKNKWLNPKDGDLIKAAIKAKAWKEIYPKAKYTVWLCTNSRIKDDKHNEIFTATELKAKELDLNVEYLEQSSIAYYLENTPTGQWIAEKHLGINAIRLSVPKLQQLCDSILNEFKKEISYTEDQTIKREDEEQSLNKIIGSKQMCNLFIGASGIGKSTLVYQLLRNHKKNGHISIRIKPQFVEASISITDAITKQLQEFQPRLKIDDDFFRLLSNNVIFIAIDDINRATNPAKLLDKIIRWNTESNFRIIIPVWPNILNQLPFKTKLATGQTISNIYINSYSKNEAILVISHISSERNLALNQYQIEKIASELFYDPFSIGIYRNLSELNSENWLKCTNNPIYAFIENEIQKIENLTQFNFYQIKDQIYSLCENMLLKKNFNVSLIENKNWFNADSLNLLNAIGKYGSIYNIDIKGTIFFKHDKIRDFILVEKIKELITNDANSTVFNEPYYAELVGKAIATIEDKNKAASIVDYLLTNLPLAVFESLHYYKNNLNIHVVHAKLIFWLKNNVHNMDEATQQSIEWCLSRLEYPNVLEITKYFKPNIFTSISSFRNGHTISGVNYLSCFNFGNSDFEPTFENNERDQLIGNFINQYGQKAITELKHLLKEKNYTIKQKENLILLAGYISSDELFSQIYDVWQSSKEELLLSTIWALINCAKDGFENILTKVFNFWLSLPEVDRNETFPEGAKKLTTFYLSRIKWNLHNESLIQFLLSIGKDKKYSNLIWSILINVDNPNVFSYVVKSLGAAEKSAVKKGGVNFSLLTFPEHWTPSKQSGRQISELSLKKLWQISKNRKGDKYIRHQAFRLWTASANKSHLNLLQSIEKADDVIYKQSLIKRAALNDYSVFEQLKEEILSANHKSEHLIIYLSLIWNNNTIVLVNSIIESNKQKTPKKISLVKSRIIYEVGELLGFIPETDLEDILENHWASLKYENEFVLLALFAGTRKCMALAQQAIQAHKNPIEIFEYFSLKLHSGKNIDGMHFESKPLSIQILENIKPYLHFLKQRDIKEIVRLAYQKNLINWIKENIVTYIDDSETHFFELRDALPSDRVLEEEFMSFATKDRIWQLDSWIDKLSKRDCNKERIVALLNNWVGKHNENHYFHECIAKCIQKIGERRDLDILENIDSNEEIRNLINNTKYRLYRRTLK